MREVCDDVGTFGGSDVLRGWSDGPDNIPHPLSHDNGYLLSTSLMYGSDPSMQKS